MMSILLSSKNGLRLSNSSTASIMHRRDMGVVVRLRRARVNPLHHHHHHRLLLQLDLLGLFIWMNNRLF